jgi:hypothetical protein
LKKDGDKRQYTNPIWHSRTATTQLIIRTITFHFSEMFMCTVRQITYSCPLEFPFIATRLGQRNKLLAQISYPNQFATAIMTSTGTLIAALKAREVQKVSQGCPFNRIG